MTPKHIVAVSGLITNAQDQVLLVKSPRRGWEFPGGQVEEGEDLIEALKRETREESGVEVQIGSMVGVYSNVTSPTKVIFGFLCEYISGELITSAESIESAWVEREHVLSLVTHPAIYDRIKDMLAYKGSAVYRVYTSDPYVVLQECSIS